MDARISDLGLATLVKEGDNTVTQTHAGGTGKYQAPEVSTKRFSNKADMYSLAIMFFEMAVGSKPELEDGRELGPHTFRPLEEKRDGTLELLQFMLKMKSSERPTAEATVREIKVLKSRAALAHLGARGDAPSHGL